MGRHEDPYRGMRREGLEQGFSNMWFGPITGTEADGAVVTCTYFVYERIRVVRCTMISTLNLPI
jgi:hypothetical protein